MAALLHLHQTSRLQRPEDNPDPENEFSVVYPHVGLQIDQFSLCMTFSKRHSSSFYRYRTWMQAPWVLTESRGPLRWDLTEKHWQSGWRGHLLLAWKYHKTWRKKAKISVPWSTSNRAVTQAKALHGSAFLRDAFLIPKKLYVVKSGSLANSKYLKKPNPNQKPTSAHISSVLQICCWVLVCSEGQFTLQRPAQPQFLQPAVGAGKVFSYL